MDKITVNAYSVFYYETIYHTMHGLHTSAVLITALQVTTCGCVLHTPQAHSTEALCVAHCVWPPGRPLHGVVGDE